jgi:hypothetical protein
MSDTDDVSVPGRAAALPVLVVEPFIQLVPFVLSAEFFEPTDSL